MNNKNICILSSWSISLHENKHYCIAPHLLYLLEFSKLFKKVYLLSPGSTELSVVGKKQIEIVNLEIVLLPVSRSLIQAQKYKKQYEDVVKRVAPLVDLFYCRVPDPFCWMPAKITSKPVIMHFVGDTVDATKKNINFSWIKKKILLAGYWFENRRIENSAKRSTVYTNGSHLAKKLIQKGISAHPVVSSTISADDLAPVPFIPLDNNPFKISYIGFLRYAKGIDTLMETIKYLEKEQFQYEFNIVGEGEMYEDLKLFIKKLKIERKVFLHGHVNNRDELFQLLRESHLFFFPSLSEGSPRVVIEAMSQGCPVLSTPVGSLPSCFQEDKEILFFEFNDAKSASKQIISLSQKLSFLEIMRVSAYQHVKRELTMDKFIRQITTL